MNKLLLICFFFCAVLLGGCQKEKSYKDNVSCPYNYVGLETDLEIDRLIQNGRYNRPIREDGVVPDAETAANIAYVYARKIYGDEIYKEIPFDVVSVNDSLWRIKGHPKFTSYEVKQGSMMMLITKSTGKVLFLFHSE